MASKVTQLKRRGNYTMQYTRRNKEDNFKSYNKDKVLFFKSYFVGYKYACQQYSVGHVEV